MTCANCGTENPEGAHFCGDCGRALPDAAASPPAPLPPLPPVPPPTEPFRPILPTAPIPPIPPAAPPAPPAPPDATSTFATAPAGPPPAAPVAQKKSRKSLLIGLVALLVVGAAVGSFLVLGGDDDSGSEAVEIVLEPIGQTLRDDFAGNLDLQRFDGSIENVLPDVPPLGDGIATALSARTADGDTPGLYGGSRDVGTCDISELIDFLTDSDNAEKAEAWAEVQGIEVDEIEDFIDDLTPVRLRFDTRVTNHGFTDGAANGFQSVLEAGTAVLVDDTGVPRVKCNCGNPLTEPVDLDDTDLDEDDALDEGLVQNIDDAWDAFDPDLIVVIVAGSSLDEFVLVDIETGELFLRPVGTDGEEDGDVDPDDVCDLLGDSPTCSEEPPDDTTTTTSSPDNETTTTIELGSGDVQVTLRWNSNADLDLAVTDPTAEEIDFGNRGPTATGGQLDIDSNVGCPADASSGVENVFWPADAAPAGTYIVAVTGFGVASESCGGGDYELTIQVAGSDDQVFTDSVAENETDNFEFTVP